ncbi:uncharacterized protein LOC125052247 [Pieris napi]|uniref:uncharacterized protein LOC125052247 n=1 Tax=Pieris napi TaxID=78633 RepID=UPI001FBA0FE1|nr:uncharacterized protein LOC125052247 [Pieris napi]
MLLFYIFTIFCVGLQLCQAEAPVTPPVRCGPIPRAIFSCLNMPKVVKPEMAEQCKDVQSPHCARMTCLFEKSGWMDGKNVDKAKIKAYLDDFAKQKAAWSAPIENVKETCLSGELPAQGIHLGCPAYDVMQCALASFIKNSEASQWSSAPHCEYPRQFAASCPICPSDCFEPQIPTGSCNACLSLPRSP